MPACLVSLGSNLGERRQLMCDAAALLRDDGLTEAVTCSRLFETPAIGGPEGQSAFLNAAAVVHTTRSTAEMLDLIQSIEQRLGRERRVRWDARSIDIDLVLYGNWIGQELRLTLPHPRLAARAFVLVPACDIAADWTDPRCGWTIQQLAEHLERQVPSLALSGSGREQRAELCQRLAARGVWTIEEPVSPTVIEVRGQAPIWRGSPDPAAEQIAVGPSFEPPADRPWVSAFVPPLPADPSADSFRAPRVVARLECSPETEPWPSPHQLWPGHGGDAVRGWPEYWIRGSDLAWMEGELQAALDSMRCDLHPITASGDW